MGTFIDGIFDRLLVIFEPAALGSAAADLVANLLIGLATFLAYYMFWRVLDLLVKLATKRLTFDETSRAFALTALKFAVLTLGLINGLAAVGVNTASLIASLGIAGLTLGFAARDALSNLISGILIFWDRPFVINDLIEIGEHYGRVDRITLRSTRVVTPDGKMLAVPNTEIINKTVASYTNFPHLQIAVPVTVGVAEDIDRVRALLLELVAQSADFKKDPPPRVVVSALNDYNVEVKLLVWIHDERRHGILRSQLREEIYKKFTREGVDMPFETLRIEPLQVTQLATA